MNRKLLLPKHLEDFAQRLKCAPQPGSRKYKDLELKGWWLVNSSEHPIFCLDKESRNLVDKKYLHKAGTGLTPTIFMVDIGVLQEINDEMRDHLATEGLAITEGWKGALALCKSNFHSCAIHGCQGGTSLRQYLKDNKIPLESVKYVFGDTDLLWNFQVTEAYYKLSKMFKKSKIYVVPPKNILTKEGYLNLRKDSPDDWIEDGFTKEQVFERVTEVNIELVYQQLEKQHTQFYKVQTYEKITNSPQQNLKNRLKEDLQAFFQTNVFFVPKTGDYYLFDENTCLWKIVDLDELAYFLIKKYSEYDLLFSTYQQIIKTVSSISSCEWEQIQSKFYNPHLLGFENGCWNFHKNIFENLHKEQYLLSFSPYKYVSQSKPKLSQVAPKICKWLSDRVDGSEIQTNSLCAVLFSCICQIPYPERFLFLTGYSSTGKSTFFLLLTSLLAPEQIYTISAEDFACDFGLEDLTEGFLKSVIIFHDIGSRVNDSFINTLRTLVSSTGETSFKRVRRKHKKTSRMHFSGFVCAASNKSPFTSVQAEGIIDRRLILLPFNKRVANNHILKFEEMFPFEEREAFVSFATKVDPHSIRNFLLQVRDHPEIASLIQDHYAEAGVTTLLQLFIENCVIYDPDNWVPYGIQNSLPETLSFSIKKWAGRLDVDFVFNKINFRQQFLPLVHSMYPNWRNIQDKRDFFNQKKVWGVQGIKIDLHKADLHKALDIPENINIPFNLREFQIQNWWINTNQQTSPETSPEASTAASTAASTETSIN